MKPFDLTLALDRHPVKLRNGTKAIVLADIASLQLPEYAHRTNTLVVFLQSTNSMVKVHRNTGRYSFREKAAFDIVGMWEEVHELADMPIDHPIMVRDVRQEHFVLMHFLKVDDTANKIVCIANTKSISDFKVGSFNTGTLAYTGWDTYQLVNKSSLVGTKWEGSEYCVDDTEEDDL